MEIIEQGSLDKKKRYIFECPNCGCKYITFIEELETMPYLIYGQIETKCPNCRNYVDGKEMEVTDTDDSTTE